MNKHINFKTLIITCIVCLSPIILGLAMWDTLPDSMAIHFNINNEPDGFASKGFAVFGLPLMMVVFQAFCCIVTDIDTSKYNEQKKITSVAKWIIPAMTIILYVVTLGYSLGWNIDIRKVVSIIIGCLFIVLGSYIPKLTHVKNYNISPEKARKINATPATENSIRPL